MPLVVLSVSIKQGAYSSHNAGYCWLSNEDGVIWAFLAPVFLVLILNTIILVSSAIRIGTARKNLDKMKQMRVALISAFILTPVLGMPWLVSFAKIITVGIENQSVLAILDRFIDWVFICLNAPAGVVFFIIILKRFLELRKSHKAKTVPCSPTTVSATHIGKFRKANSLTGESSFGVTTSVTGYTIRNSRVSMTGVNNLAYDESCIQNVPNTPPDIEGGIELEDLPQRGVSQMTCDDNYTQDSDGVKLTASDDVNGTKNILSRGLDFIKTSFRNSFMDTDIDAEADSSQNEKNSPKKSYPNIYLEHLQELAESGQAIPEVITESEDTVGDIVKLRKKSVISLSRLSCEHEIKVKELKEYFDDPVNSPISMDREDIPVTQDDVDPPLEHLHNPSGQTEPEDPQTDNVFEPSVEMPLPPIQPHVKKSADTPATSSLEYTEVIKPKQRRSADAPGVNQASWEVFDSDTSKTIPKKANSTAIPSGASYESKTPHSYNPFEH